MLSVVAAKSNKSCAVLLKKFVNSEAEANSKGMFNF